MTRLLCQKFHYSIDHFRSYNVDDGLQKAKLHEMTYSVNEQELEII